MPWIINTNFLFDTQFHFYNSIYFILPKITWYVMQLCRQHTMTLGIMCAYESNSICRNYYIIFLNCYIEMKDKQQYNLSIYLYNKSIYLCLC